MRMRCIVVMCVVLGLLPFANLPARGQEDSECFFCHGEPDLTKTLDDGRVVSLYIDKETYDAGIHEPNGCISCHADIVDIPHAEDLEPVDCGTCHLEPEEYAESVHGRDLINGGGDVTGCGDCHGKHGIRPGSDPLSSTYPLNLPETCGKCHHDADLAKRHMMPLIDPTMGYLKGVHSKAMREGGNLEAATCNDCHGTHRILPLQDPESPIYRANIPKTCGQCHADTLAEYDKSIHGQALAAGVQDAPTCIDCHGEHAIAPRDESDSPVSKAQISESTCPRCHNDTRIMSKFGIETMREASYMDSFHGMAGVAGSNVVASCTSCHGVHDILPPEDPNSSVNPANRVETCRKCHESANENFAVGKVHIMPTAPDQWVLGLVRVVYIWLIVLTLGGMALHNALFMIRRALRKYAHEKASRPDTYRRFNGVQILGHMVLATSFIVLVLSGFALRYPDAWWARLLFWGDMGLEVRGLVHRIAAVALIAVTAGNIIYVIVSRQARKDVVAFIITLRDVKDIFANLAYVVGLHHTPPRFDRYSYAEKLEYWGLWWGSFVMIVTGFCMWFPENFMQYFPKLALDVAALIHYYEAWLAAGTIIIWHWYHVAFDPSAYPMNWSWLTGHITEKEFREHHPLQWEREMGTPANPDPEDE